MKKHFLLAAILSLTLPCFSQKMFSGIVIDSASFEELPNVIITVKHSERRTISSIQGEFTIQATNVDTIIFVLLGYHSFELPLYFEEEVLLIRMTEQIRILDEITIRATRLYPNDIVNRTKESPKMMSALEGILSPFDYFWKLEREKRKLAKIIEDNNKTQTYLQVINDPLVKTIMMRTYDVTELVYYETVAAFNQQRKFISYSSDPEEIMESLHDFFKKNSK